MPIMHTPREQAISDLKMVKVMLYFLGLARSSCMTREVVTGVYSKELHDLMHTHKTFPQLIIEQECLDNPEFANKRLGWVLRNLPDRLAWPGSNTMQWTIAKPQDCLVFGPVVIDGQHYLFIESHVLEKKVSVLHAAATKAGKAQWEDEYAAEKAATWEKYENTMSPQALRAHVLVERQDAPKHLNMLKLEYLRLNSFPYTKVAVRLRSRELLVTRDAPGTPEWHQFYDYKHTAK